MLPHFKQTFRAFDGLGIAKVAERGPANSQQDLALRLRIFEIEKLFSEGYPSFRTDVFNNFIRIHTVQSPSTVVYKQLPVNDGLSSSPMGIFTETGEKSHGKGNCLEFYDFTSSCLSGKHSKR